MRMPSFPKTITVGYDFPSGSSAVIYDGGRGYWHANCTYFKDEYVYYGGKHFKCLKDGVISTPVDGVDWLQGSFSTEASGIVTHKREADNGRQTSRMSYQVEFASPITSAAIQISNLYGFGRSEMGSSHSGAVKVYINDVLTWSAGEVGHNSPISFGEFVPRVAVSKIYVYVMGTQDGGIQPHGGYTGIGEVGLYIPGDADYGYIL